jgi:hypothetical protein
MSAESSPYNDFILHNSKRATADVLLITEEDYIDQDEAQPGQCHGQGKFETWQIKAQPADTVPLDTWSTELNGFLTGGSAEDSKAPVTANCSSHWFDYRRGVAAVGWYEQGVRLLDVRNPRDIRQVGYYLPVNGSTWAAYWAPNSPNILYAADPVRGIDVLRVDGAGNPSAATVAAPILPGWFGITGSSASVPGFTPSPLYGWGCALPDPRSSLGS